MTKNQLVVLCGVDGSGKSTLLKEIEGHLSSKNIDFVSFHSHQYAISGNSFAMTEEKIFAYRYIFTLLLPLAWIDNWYSYLTKYIPNLSKKWVLSDRYFYDKVARLIYYGICPQLIAKIYLMLLPKPNQCFILVADSTRIQQRKSEHTVDEINKFQEIYRFIADQVQAEVINTNVPVRRSVEQILVKIS